MMIVSSMEPQPPLCRPPAFSLPSTLVPSPPPSSPFLFLFLLLLLFFVLFLLLIPSIYTPSFRRLILLILMVFLCFPLIQLPPFLFLHPVIIFALLSLLFCPLLPPPSSPEERRLAGREEEKEGRTKRRRNGRLQREREAGSKCAAEADDVDDCCSLPLALRAGCWRRFGCFGWPAAAADSWHRRWCLLSLSAAVVMLLLRSGLLIRSNDKFQSVSNASKKPPVRGALRITILHKIP